MLDYIIPYLLQSSKMAFVRGQGYMQQQYRSLALFKGLSLSYDWVGYTQNFMTAHNEVFFVKISPHLDEDSGAQKQQAIRW